MKTLPVSQAKDFNVWYDDIVKRTHTILKGVTIMAAYTIEDIELIRRKSGISYQEHVALLDYHNGNVARALGDL